jgi:hypothetical protein
MGERPYVRLRRGSVRREHLIACQRLRNSPSAIAYKRANRWDARLEARSRQYASKPRPFFYSDGSVAQAPADGFTQHECLVSPHHFTFSGVCYESTNATIQISSPQHPQP